MICRKSDKESCLIAADYIRHGKVVILPTETVYGFSGIVDGRHYSYHTDKKIQEIKGREESKHFIQLLAKIEDLKKYTRDVVPDELLKLWPGPLTIIVHTFAKDGNFVTTAFRCPGDEWLRKVIGECGAPIYSTSVNKSGKPILGNILQIKEEFGKDVDLIVEDGDKTENRPSTIVSIGEDGSVKLVRQGCLDVSFAL
ncbi:L-threonylcarbamoyladenylate synthase [Treponema pectinovorum]|uniref:L-threonylcarbamoyladenylate synthase n=1 Tax=Treponema pectinovorum TaxID=164 RepID=UPI003D8A9310